MENRSHHISVHIVIMLILFSPWATAGTRTWTDASGDGLASTQANWNPVGPLSAADNVVLDSTSVNDLIWDAGAPDTVASWLQTADYTGTVTFETVYPDGDPGSFTSFTIDGDCIISSGVWTHRDNAGEPASYRLWVIVGNNMTIEGAASVNVDFRGFEATRKGPGAQGTTDNIGSTHGGVGGRNKTAATYGSFSDPVLPGSSGWNSDGGGVAVLVVDGTLSVNGSISANAEPSDRSAGSGGSINLTAAVLEGNGVIRVRGGNGSRSGGGGGRISLINVADNRFTGLIEVHGGTGGSTAAQALGHSGTIAFPDGYDLTLGGEGNMQTLRLGTDDDAVYSFRSITIFDGGTLEIDGHPHMDNLYSSAATIYADEIDIRAGGALSAEGLGLGLRKGAPDNWQIGDTTAGAYGGAGGGNVRTYGSIMNPVNLGSSSQFRGGGALILRVSGVMNVDGDLTSSALTSDRGSGSGGTINVIAAGITGSGNITANGGQALRHGGGGGRIALRAPVSTFNGAIEAGGGRDGSTTTFFAGGAGTVYTDLNGERLLEIDTDQRNTAGPVHTYIPAWENAPVESGLKDARVIIRNLANVALTEDITVGDLILETD